MARPKKGPVLDVRDEAASLGQAPSGALISTDSKNANKGTERGQYLLKRSMESYGAGRSVLADKNGVLIAGNKTHKTAVDLGIPVRVIETDGTELVVVQRTDLDLNTDRAARELAYADNRVAEIDLEWDAEQVKEDLEFGVGLDGFFQAQELEEMMKSFAADFDRAPKQNEPEPDAGVPTDRVASTGTQQIVMTFQVEDAKTFFKQVRELISVMKDVQTVTDVVQKVVDEAYRSRVLIA